MLLFRHPGRPQHGARAGEAGHHGADWSLDDVGDLAIRKILNLAQYQRLTEWLGQRGHEFLDRRCLPLAQDMGQTHSALLLLYGTDGLAHVAFDAGNSGRDIAHDLAIVAAR